MFSGLKKYMEIRDFIVKNWQYISSALVILVTIIFAFVKKRPVTEIIDSSGYQIIVSLIKKAEDLFGAGEGKKKLEYVIQNYASQKNITRQYGFDNAIERIVNEVLDTPERKEKK